MKKILLLGIVLFGYSLVIETIYQDLCITDDCESQFIVVIKNQKYFNACTMK